MSFDRRGCICSSSIYFTLGTTVTPSMWRVNWRNRCACLSGCDRITSSGGACLSTYKYFRLLFRTATTTRDIRRGFWSYRCRAGGLVQRRCADTRLRLRPGSKEQRHRRQRHNHNYLFPKRSARLDCQIHSRLFSRTPSPMIRLFAIAPIFQFQCKPLSMGKG